VNAPAILVVPWQRPADQIPDGWRVVERRADGARYRRGPLQVIESRAREQDGREWQHVSASRDGVALPTWTDLARVKRAFIGDERTAYQVLPPAVDYVNDNPGVLHLWSCLDPDKVLPDFTQGTGSI
jgi:hypothetical protein